MIIQPPADGSHMPRQMVSRVEGGGPKQTTPHDKAMCAKARGEALKKQREALGAPVVIKAASHPDHEKSS
ncbi:MAG: hypothetical protein V4458_10285 [Pseudomonadota bacterium]|nr:hypothetical protein [Afipia sp.]